MSLLQSWINLAPDASPGLCDRAFKYGDCLFETLRYCRGRFHWLDLHLQRLRRGCELLGMPLPEDLLSAQLHQSLQWLREQGVEEAAVRLSLSRGESLRGYGDVRGEPGLGLALTDIDLPWRVVADPAALVICDLRLSDQPRLAGIKHGNRLEQVLAAAEVREAGADEGLLLDQGNHLVCAVSANLFAVVDGTLLTPPIVNCGVAGTVRRLIIEGLATRCGLAVEEQALPADDLHRASELFLTNALLGLRSVSRCPGRSFTSAPVADTLRECFFEQTELAPPCELSA